MQVQPHVTSAASLAHTHLLLIHPERPPRAPSPMALPGRPFPSCLVLPSRVPCRVIRSSHLPQASCPLCPGEASLVSGGRNKRYPRGLPHTAQRSAPAYWPRLSDGPGLGSRWPAASRASHLTPVLPTGASLSNSVLTAQKGRPFTCPSQLTGLSWAGPSQDTELTWAGTRQGSAPSNPARSPRCRAPQPACRSELTLSTSEQDLN